MLNLCFAKALYRAPALLLTVIAVSAVAQADGSLTPDQLALFQDSSGWEYISMGDTDAGIKTQHTCFDGHPHPNTCSGTLTFSPSKTFVQKVFIHHQSVSRHGTYQLDGNQLSFFDEFGTRDGPYAVSLDTHKKTLTLAMPHIQIQLLLLKEYKKQAH